MAGAAPGRGPINPGRVSPDSRLAPATTRSGGSVGRCIGALLTVGQMFLFGVMPVFVNLGVLLSEGSTRSGVAYDFRLAMLPAARAVMHGDSPYGPATLAALRPGTAFVYPPVAAFLFAPLTALPTQVAGYVVSLLVLACAPATLWLLGVRDWRCYGASLLWAPVVSSMHLGALSLPLALLTAVVWQYRSRLVGPAVALAAAIALKLFLWPMLVWLASTRRQSTLRLAAGVGAVLIAVPWAVIGFAGLGEYPHMLRLLSSIEAPESYSVAAVAAKVGFAWTFAQVVSYCVGSALLAAVIVTARRRDDRASFALSIAAVLAVSPIVWSHYFALLLVPVAIFSPRFGVAWLLPIGLFAFPMTPGACSLWQLTMALGLAAATMALSAGLPRGRGIGAVQAGGVELPLIGVPGIRSTRRSG